MTDESQRDERVIVPSPLHGEVQVYQPMTILDISRGGTQIETAFSLQVDSLHDFRISLGERSIVVKGRIASCHVGESREGVTLHRIGVEFIETSGHVQSALTHFVEALKLVQRAHAPTPSVIEGQIAE
ncbi:MAG TPA: PilZ domain-containing protein [Vicinamibacterales bacterium]|jgi:c-di-GMP-binding flagellar brake protein YcgR